MLICNFCNAIVAFVVWNPSADHHWWYTDGTISKLHRVTDYGHTREFHKTKSLRSEYYSVYDPRFKKIMPMYPNINCHLS